MADIGSKMKAKGPFGVADATDIVGGVSQVGDIGARDDIQDYLRVQGMVVTVTDDADTANNGDWEYTGATGTADNDEWFQRESGAADIGKRLKVYDFYGGTVGGIDSAGDGLIFNSGNVTTAEHSRSFEFRRITNHSGSTNQYENALLQVNLTTNATAASVETALLVQLENNAVKSGSTNGGQNACMHIRALKKSNAPTWCIAFEAQDDYVTADPAYGLHVTESVMAAKGTDASNNRVVHDIIASRPSVNLGAGPVYSGDACEIGYGVRFSSQVADAEHNKFKTNIGIEGYTKLYGLNMANCTFDAGAKAINLPQGQGLYWGGTQGVFHSTVNNALTVTNGASNIALFKDGGDAWLYSNLQVGGTEGTVGVNTGYAQVTAYHTTNGGLLSLANATSYLQLQTVNGGGSITGSTAIVFNIGGTEYARFQSNALTLTKQIELPEDTTIRWNSTQKIYHSASLTAMVYSNGSANTINLKDDGNAWFYGSVQIGGSEGTVATNAGHTTFTVYNSANSIVEAKSPTDYIRLQTTSSAGILQSQNATIGKVGSTEYWRDQSGAHQLSVPLKHASYTIATVPSVSAFSGQHIYVSDMAGGAGIAVSDGTTWRKQHNRSSISQADRVRVNPSDGASISMPSGSRRLRYIINPAGALASLTVAPPSSPEDGDEMWLISNVAITAMQLSGSSYIGRPSSLNGGAYTAGTPYGFVYDSSNGYWSRLS